MPRRPRRISRRSMHGDAVLCWRPARRRRAGLALERQRARPSPTPIARTKGASCPHNSANSPVRCPSKPPSPCSPSPALKAAGKDVVELEIGDSPFDSTAAARAGGMEAIKNNQSHYCPSPGLPEFRAAAAEFVREEFGIPAEREQHRRRPRRQGVRAVLLRSVLESRRRRARLQPVLPDLHAEHRAPRRARRADAAQAGERVPARRRRHRAVPETTIRRRARSS